MINYNWNCKTVDVYPANGDYTDVVYNVHWIVTGEDEDANVSATNIGTQVLDTSDITDFIPFNELTNEEVVAWVKSAIGEEMVSELENNIEKEISEKKNPTSITMTIEN